MGEFPRKSDGQGRHAPWRLVEIGPARRSTVASYASPRKVNSITRAPGMDAPRPKRALPRSEPAQFKEFQAACFSRVPLSRRCSHVTTESSRRKRDRNSNTGSNPVGATTQKFRYFALFPPSSISSNIGHKAPEKPGIDYRSGNEMAMRCEATHEGGVPRYQ